MRSSGQRTADRRLGRERGDGGVALGWSCVKGRKASRLGPCVASEATKSPRSGKSARVAARSSEQRLHQATDLLLDGLTGRRVS